MRKIKFRGKSIDGKEWLYGDLVSSLDEKRFSILENDKGSNDICEVDPETIGQFTGLMDKNGNEIYEGDIVEWEKDNRKYVVKFWEGMLYASVEEYNEGILGGFPLHVFTQGDEGYRCEIVGNIHDNTELLKGGGK